MSALLTPLPHYSSGLTPTGYTYQECVTAAFGLIVSKSSETHDHSISVNDFGITEICSAHYDGRRFETHINFRT